MEEQDRLQQTAVLPDIPNGYSLLAVVDMTPLYRGLATCIRLPTAYLGEQRTSKQATCAKVTCISQTA